MTLVKNKVEKEQVYVCEKEFYEIRKLIERRKEVHLLNLTTK